MVKKYLLDTNIFLEILLLQAKQNDCKKFIENHFDEIALSQFSLNSIGVSCYRNKSVDVFTSFLRDIASSVPVFTLNVSQLLLMEAIISNYNLDYDDSYQFVVAQTNNLEILILDSDFKKVEDLLKIHFL